MDQSLRLHLEVQREGAGGPGYKNGGVGLELDPQRTTGKSVAQAFLHATRSPLTSCTNDQIRMLFQKVEP